LRDRDTSIMSHFCLLSDPDNYTPEDLELRPSRAEMEALWLKHFEESFARTMNHASHKYGRGARKQIEAASEEFNAMIRRLREDPTALNGGELNVLSLDRFRDEVLRKYGLRDPFADMKERANASASKLYPRLVKTLHAMDDEEKWLRLVECVFAGNIFDTGSDTGTQLTSEPEEFFAILEETKPRPWLIDDYDALEEVLLSPPPLKWGKAVVFIDNAGADFILGVMPLVREMAMAGVSIVLAANEGPALNDLTVDETIDAVEMLTAEDGDLAALVQAGMFEVVSTGSTVPLLDLSDVTDELNEAAADADLVILEGMGRAVETNFNAAFRVDCLRLALLKLPEVAVRLGGEVFDCVCKYTPAEQR